MPDKDGKLSDAEKAATWENLNAKLSPGGAQCPGCAENNWHLGDHVVTPIAAGERLGIFGSVTAYLQILLICRNCGFTRTYSAKRLGLTQYEKEEEAPDDPDEVVNA